MGDGGRKWSDHGELRFLSGFFFFFFGFGVVWCESGFLDMVSYRRLLATVEAAVLVGAKPEPQHRADLSHALHVSFSSFESFIKYPVSLLSVTLRKAKKMKSKMGFPLVFHNFLGMPWAAEFGCFPLPEKSCRKKHWFCIDKFLLSAQP